MKETVSGKDKIQQICSLLKKEAIEPAKQEANEIVENAQMQASEIVGKATQEAEKLLAEAEKKIEEKKRAFESSLAMASSQAVEGLKQQIEAQLFSKALNELVTNSTVDSKLLAQLIEVIIEGIKKDGVNSDLSVLIGNNFNATEVSESISKSILEMLKEKEVVLGGFANGVAIKIHEQNITLDLSEEALTDLLTQFVRKDFRKFFFTK